MASQNYIRERSCYPNRLCKEAAGATLRIMDSTYFFTPNPSFENTTFTQVKVIDIAWYLIVGGGQMGLAWLTSPVVVGDHSNANNTYTQSSRMADDTQLGHLYGRNGPDFQVHHIDWNTDCEFEGITYTLRSGVKLSTHLSTGKFLRDPTAQDQQYYNMSG
ncbi:hypothetical protein BU25DRAFT_457697 [Macroventuria anomochaeta]|uniref:Uncharacterized protein n=1 Tax=Macroventuria anomochaeta TaxID=301207 RepID=A0ACB6S295_9PLEO|nr:uncharacterized protein BU25DRAFT_457697 [Macroventuria anomochaeta]KAF2628365.1 hypothetical protein BU25DRAFT_457697 [Macroventuria anomochaeta]